MKLSCTIDENRYNLNVNADKPLNRILNDMSEAFAVNSSCQGVSCGNCIVLLNGVSVLSCLIPAFKLNDANIQTFEGFRKTRGFHDIERAYDEANCEPCAQCYASKTLLLESILFNLEQNQASPEFMSTEYISRELGINRCRCVEISQLEKVVRLAYGYRSVRSGRHTQ